MVARTPPKQRKMVAPLNPILLRETLKKVDKCMARLQELQYTVNGGNKVISGVSLSPRSTRGYLRTSLRCKHESLRIKSDAPRKSPVGKFPSAKGGEWKRMSLPAMLLGETVGEILQASQFTREIVASVVNKNKKTTPQDDPKTPLTQRRNHKPYYEDETEFRVKRQKEKQNKLPSKRIGSISPPLQRTRSRRINFKVSPPHNKREVVDKENVQYSANRVSPRNRPWAKKTVLFPNPLFQTSLPSSSQQQQHKFCKTRSPVITRTNKQQTTPHKFLIKSPPLSGSKIQVRIKSPPPLVSSLSPTRMTNLSKKSPKMSTASKLRRSFSPSRLATRLVSPLKSRKSISKNEGPSSGVKQRPSSPLLRISAMRIR